MKLALGILEQQDLAQTTRMSADADPNLKSLAIEARARIIWGESPEQIREWLAANGLQKQDIDFVVELSSRERALEIRKMGLTDLAIGIPVAALGLAVTILLTNGREHFSTSRIVGAAILAALYGLWRTVRGIDRLICGSRIRGSIPDM